MVSFVLILDYNEMLLTHLVNVPIYLALLRESRRDKLVRAFDSLTKKQLDERRSADKEADLWDEVVEDFNDEDWQPLSYKFPTIHSKFSVEMDLSINDSMEALSRESAKRIINDLFARYK